MKNTIAALIAGLFATAAFAQTPAPGAPAAAVKAEAKHETQAAKVEAKETKAEAKTEAKEAKTATRHAKAKTKHAAKTTTAKLDAAKDTTVAAATPAATN
jgi:hypothetical protein